ncbi:MAG: EI24 domain-containing protein [Chitinophagales bacterium]|nr:EI24 domain-containing protein [Chitinophagales bacterium]
MGQIVKIFRDFMVALSTLKGQALKYMMYSGLIGMALVGILIWITVNSASWMGMMVASWIPWEWAQQSVFFSVIIGIAIIWFFWIVLKYILLILSGPMLSLASEKLEQQLGMNTGMRGFSFAASTARSVRINMRNLLKELVLTALLFISGLIPGLNLIALILLLLVQSYFAGFGIMDYYLERHFTYRESLKVVYNHKWAAIGLGAIFTILFLIPVLGVLIAPYLSTAAATRYFVRENIQTPA